MNAAESIIHRFPKEIRLFLRKVKKNNALTGTLSKTGQDVISSAAHTLICIALSTDA